MRTQMSPRRPQFSTALAITLILTGSRVATPNDPPQRNGVRGTGESLKAELPKGRTLLHHYGALRMAFPTPGTLDPANRPRAPKSFGQEPVPLQIHRVVATSSNDPNRIVLGSDDEATTTFWTRTYKAEGNVPERLVSCVGMPEVEWILDRYTFVRAGDITVKGLRVRGTLKDYRWEEGTEKAGTVVPNVVHVLVEDLDPDNHNPGSVTFLLPKGKSRVFVLSEKQGLFVLSDLAFDGSPLVSMRGWIERIPIRDHLEGLGFQISEEGVLMMRYGTQGIEWAESYIEQACENHGTSLTLRSDLVRGSRGYDQAPGLAWRVSGGGSTPQQEALVSLASAISPASGRVCSAALEESKVRNEEVKKEHQGVLVKVKEGKVLSLESIPGPAERSD